MSKTKKTPSAKTAPKAPKAKKADLKVAVEETRATDAAANAASVNPDIVPLKEALKPATKTAKKIKEPKAEKPAKAPRSSGLSAAYQILLDAGEPMQCKAMVEKILAAGTWKTSGKTPAATIYAAVIREIRAKGSDSRFRKTDRGLFEAIKQ